VIATAAGAKSLRQKSQERVEAILADHRAEPLDPDVRRAIDDVLNRVPA
jgi:trimethylamine:corrinoid methyltransferase-like protein